MNICFVVDRSISMLQKLENLNFLDSIKYAIEKIVDIREKENKIDKYLLICNDKIMSLWEDSVIHFINRVKAIETSV